MKSKILTFLPSAIKDDEYNLIRKVMMVNAFFIVGMVAFLSFSVINIFLTLNYFVGFLDLFAFCIFLYSYLDLKKKKNIHRSSVIGTTLLVLFMFSFAYINHNNSFGLIWTIFIPIFIISLFGAKTGLRLSILFYIPFLSLLLYGVYYWNDENWNLISFLRLAFASSVLLFVIYTTESSFEKISESLKKLTNIDPLTSLYNRRKIDEIISNKFYDFDRYKTKFCIALIDIDDFKNINDTFGHATGDQILKEFAKILKENSRQTDDIGRWGGEEFMFIMHNIELKDAVSNMNKILNEVRSHHFGVVENVTCSIGISEADTIKNDINKLFKCADEALFQAKASGKNSVYINKNA